ncbi:MAG: hypothetical protein ACYCXB_01215 [Candidatus Humimicrobiaceae bacterium]
MGINISQKLSKSFISINIITKKSDTLMEDLLRKNRFGVTCYSINTITVSKKNIIIVSILRPFIKKIDLNVKKTLIKKFTLKTVKDTIMIFILKLNKQKSSLK